MPFLIGLAWFDVDSTSLVVEQLLLRDVDDEAALLDRVRARVEAAELCVSYNGKSFDMPLLAARMVMARVGPLPRRPHEHPSSKTSSPRSSVSTL